MEAHSKLIRVAASLLQAAPLPSDVREDYPRKTITTKWVSERMGRTRDWLRGQSVEVKMAADEYHAHIDALTSELTSAKEEIARLTADIETDLCGTCWMERNWKGRAEAAESALASERKETERLREDLLSLYQMVAQADTNKALSSGGSRQNILVVTAQDIGRRHGFFNYWTQAALQSRQGEE